MEIQKNDIVQVVPGHKWGGCLVQVSEPKSFGIQGFVQIPMDGAAFIRLNFEDFEKVGRAVFIPNEEDE